MQEIKNLSLAENAVGKKRGFWHTCWRIITSKRFLWIGSPIMILVIWELVARFGSMAPYILPSPTAIIAAGVELAASGELLTHILASLGRAVPAFIIGSIAGIILGLMMGWSQTVNTIMDIPFNIFRAIPKVALIPVFMVWFGLGEFSKILVILLSPFAKLAINTQAGVKSVNTAYIKAARALGANDWAILREVVLPSSLPMIFAGLRLSVVISMILLVIVEMVGASSGLGYLIRDTGDFLQTDKMFAGVLVLALLALAMDGLVRLAESKVLVWQKGRTIART